MELKAEEIIPISEADQNFSSVARIADRSGRAIIFRNNKPKYMLVDLDRSPVLDLIDDEKIDIVAARILKRHKAAFQELAK